MTEKFLRHYLKPCSVSILCYKTIIFLCPLSCCWVFSWAPLLEAFSLHFATAILCKALVKAPIVSLVPQLSHVWSQWKHPLFHYCWYGGDCSLADFREKHKFFLTTSPQLSCLARSIELNPFTSRWSHNNDIMAVLKKAAICDSLLWTVAWEA